MNAIDLSPPTSASARWGGRILTGVPLVFLTFSGTIKLIGIPEVARSMAHLGMPAGLAPAIGVLELACVILCLIPSTRVAGTILATGFLGGAVASHLRVGDPLATHTLFPIYVGALLWAGLYVRDPRVRALVAPNRYLTPTRGGRR